MANFKSNQAFVLLYAVLVASVVLAIGFSLANIITKQIILSSLGQSSRVAYYAADGGRDCGLFWSKFTEIITYGDSLFGDSGAPPVRCGLENFGAVTNITNLSPAETKLLNLYGIDLISYNYQVYSLPAINFDGEACSKVTVFSFGDDNSQSPNYRRIVLSRGFSTGCNSQATNRMVSRTVISTDTW
ncbi:MAG: hypothetical protein COX02_01885 [Candidatus Vogelbacteria bacterium CG22_combo_CG10-13_8_21_14_all_37_9]|uniref:Type 4 fimbrial biogenesis protein PilX N-terminal domain-containing protein n=1 Tax=Candidatus Vogelbacteria bacterium CG22_combo_CG10-13_8_21_14_all_37_9 TaxID=1975046 RepID=A0A2H0BKD3_9BACT|nr:MAG: hypothetical protein BK005_00955 [bacterium CG10_37_50]PIP58135.1 MAG: hypothetical protein COX02_01885 [Candidatus Vogelbacteria bacterium CG22_combo_CG10-13_8_21_14_all_37_9]